MPEDSVCFLNFKSCALGMVFWHYISENLMNAGEVDNYLDIAVRQNL